MKPELPHDPVLPQLAIALDPLAMREVFARAIAFPLVAVEVDRVKYRPRRNLAVSYRLVCGARDGRQFEQRVAARFCAGGEGARRHAKACQREQWHTAAGPRLTHHSALDMSAHWWPNDAKLTAAAVLADPAAMGRRFVPEVARLVAPDDELVGHRLTLAQVVPEHRLTARVRLDLGTRSESVYAKADAERRGPQTHAVMLSLWASPAQRRGDLITPKPLLWQGASGLHWQQALPGQPLLDLAPQVDAATSAQVGTLVAALHGTAAPAARTCGLDELRQLPLEVAGTLARVDGDRFAGARPLAMALASTVTELALAPMVTLHGDLHPRNLLRAPGNRLSLIDFDSVRRGPNVLDVGSWIADAIYRARLADRPLADALPACHAFIEAYAHASGARTRESILAWAVAYQLLCQRAWRGVVNLKPGRYERVAGLIALAERIVRAGHIDAVAEVEAEAA